MVSTSYYNKFLWLVGINSTCLGNWALPGAGFGLPVTNLEKGKLLFRQIVIDLPEDCHRIEVMARSVGMAENALKKKFSSKKY